MVAHAPPRPLPRRDRQPLEGVCAIQLIRLASAAEIAVQNNSTPWRGTPLSRWPESARTRNRSVDEGYLKGVLPGGWQSTQTKGQSPWPFDLLWAYLR